jgi:hypothetical protein
MTKFIPAKLAFLLLASFTVAQDTAPPEAAATQEKTAPAKEQSTAPAQNQIRTEQQARELCEQQLRGALVADAKSYQELLKVHQAAGFQPLVDSKELAFEQVAKPVEGGFQIEFTAFHLPQKMGAESEVARYEFFVSNDGQVKTNSKMYLQGITLNWQTLSLNTKKAQEREQQAQLRVKNFIQDCYKHCSTKLPRKPEDTKKE